MCNLGKWEGSGGGDVRSKRMGWNGVTYLYQDCLDEDRSDGIEGVCWLGMG